MSKELQAATQAIEKMTALGAEESSAQAITSKKSEFNVEGGKFTLLRTTLDHSLSLQALKGQKRGTVNSNSFEEDAIASAATDCVSSAEAGQADPAWEFAREGQKEVVSGDIEPDMEKLFARTQELIDTVHQNYPKVILEQVTTDHTMKTGVYLNSHGVKYTTTAGYYGVSMMFSGHEGDKSSSFNGAGFYVKDLDKPFIEMASLKQNLKDAENQIHTVPAKGKYEGTVIFTPDCLGGMLGELISNFASDGTLLDGTSKWKDKVNTKVADERITIHVAPGNERVVIGQTYTGEGFEAQDYDLIENGVLKQFMLSAYGANKTGNRRAPNSSFALVMKPGETSVDELIKNTKKGLLVSRYSGGASGASGEFSGVAKNSFLIEDGKIGSAVSETMIAGNLADMLNRVEGISRETVEDGTGSLPYLAVGGITISGQ